MNRVPHAALLLAVSCVSVAQSSWSQPSSDPLPRRGWFGVALGTNDAGNVIVTSVQPGTTAAEMGIEAGYADGDQYIDAEQYADGNRYANRN
jgi:hypothetical protein